MKLRLKLINYNRTGSFYCIHRMESKTNHLRMLRILLLFSCILGSCTYSDMGKISSQSYFGSSSQSQFTTKNNTKVIAQKGGLAIMPCVVKVNSPATVSWIRRKDFQLLTVGLSTHSSDKRFLVEHTRHMGHWSLRIKSVREDDRGFYECQLSIYPTQSILIELRVVEAVAEITGAPDLHIDETSTLRLECKLKRATENPAFVFWYHDNKMVNYDSQGGFSVTSTTSHNGPTLIDNASVQLPNSIGGGSPKPRLTGIALNSHATSNNNTSSSSSGNSLSSHSLSSLSSSSLSSSSSSSLSSLASYAAALQHQSSYLLTPSMSILTIKEVHFQHAGNYTCAPSNARPASITVHVLRGEKPAAMQHANRSILDIESISSSNNTIGLSSGMSGISGASDLLDVKALFGVKLSISSLILISSQPQHFKIHLFLTTPTILFGFSTVKR